MWKTLVRSEKAALQGIGPCAYSIRAKKASIKPCCALNCTSRRLFSALTSSLEGGSFDAAAVVASAIGAHRGVKELVYTFMPKE